MIPSIDVSFPQLSLGFIRRYINGSPLPFGSNETECIGFTRLFNLPLEPGSPEIELGVPVEGFNELKLTPSFSPPSAQRSERKKVQKRCSALF